MALIDGHSYFKHLDPPLLCNTDYSRYGPTFAGLGRFKCSLSYPLAAL